MSSETPSRYLGPNEVNPSTRAAPAPVALPVPTFQAGRFYRVDSSRLSFTELWRHTRSPLVPIVWLTKLLRIRLREGSVNDPNVPSLRPFAVPESEVETAIPPEVRAKMQPALRELADLGFGSPVYFVINDVIQHACAYHAAMTHRDGKAVARLHVHVEGVQRSRMSLFDEFVSALPRGRFVWSTSARAQSFPPPVCRLNWKYGASASQLWLSHRQELDSVLLSEGAAQPVRTREEMLELLERHHEAVRDFNLERGVFSQMKGEDLARAEALERHFEQARGGGLKNPEVMAHLERMQKQQTSWTSAIMVLLVSVGLFIGAGAGSDRWPAEFLLIIVGVLLFHEAGHYLAMKVFRYRNVRMFFIPFLGAAVSGQHYTAPGWKKVIVALMGPLPGILVGGILGVAGLIAGNELTFKIGICAIVLNAFNLLPVLPLDGGRVMHAMLFCRHYSLDVVFRVFAAAALIGIGLLVPDKILVYLGIFMLIGVSAAYKVGRIATELRRERIGLPGQPSAGAGALRPVFVSNVPLGDAQSIATPEPIHPVAPPAQAIRPGPSSFAVPPPAEPAASSVAQEHSIPVPVADLIVDRVRTAFPRIKGAKPIASLTLQVYEGLTSRPPGIAASIGFAFLHLGSFAAALVLLLVLFILKNPEFMDRYSLDTVNPTHGVDAASILTHDGPAAGRAPSFTPAPVSPESPSSRHRGYDLIVATFPTLDEARDTFQEIRQQMPPAASITLFGQSVFLSLPSSDASGRLKWFGDLESRTKDVFVDSGDGNYLASLTLTGEAPSRTRAATEQQELSDYFQLPGMLRLLPPWAGEEIDRRSEQDRKRHQLARATYRKLQKVSVYDAPEMKAMGDKMALANRRSDRAEQQRLLKEQSELEFQLRMRALERIRDGREGAIDRELAERYIAIQVAEHGERTAREASKHADHKITSQPASAVAGKKPEEAAPGDDEEIDREFGLRMEQMLRRQQAELGPLMGQLSHPSAGPPLASSHTHCLHRYGYAQMTPPTQLVVTVTFEDASVGAPALVKWLAGRGYSDFKYELRQDQQYGFEGDE